jgi:hypothetical protein
MRSFQRRRRAIARDIQRTISHIEQARSKTGTPVDQADEVVTAIKDYKASRAGRKIKEPLAS